VLGAFVSLELALSGVQLVLVLQIEGRSAAVGSAVEEVGVLGFVSLELALSGVQLVLVLQIEGRSAAVGFVKTE